VKNENENQRMKNEKALVFTNEIKLKNKWKELKKTQVSN
jgi:hypothetical protein